MRRSSPPLAVRDKVTAAPTLVMRRRVISPTATGCASASTAPLGGRHEQRFPLTDTPHSATPAVPGSVACDGG